MKNSLVKAWFYSLEGASIVMLTTGKSEPAGSSNRERNSSSDFALKLVVGVNMKRIHIVVRNEYIKAE